MLSNPLIAQSANDWPKTRKLIFVICLLSFVFQLYRITAHYYRYETEFQTKLFNGDKEVLDLPAITLCAERDAIFLKSAIRRKFPDINKYLSVVDRNVNMSSAEREAIKDRFYLHFLERGLNYVNFYDRSLDSYDLTECYLHQATKWMSRKRERVIFKDCLGSSPVLESRVSLDGHAIGLGKCFTFFSRQHNVPNGITDLQINMKDLEAYPTILSIFLILDLIKDAVPLSTDGPIDTNNTKKSLFLFLHDPYGMPSFDTIDSIELKAGKRYDIRFWSTTKSLLKHPFPSDCYDYHKNFDHANSNGLSKSKDQCVHDCYIDTSQQELRCLTSYFTPFLTNGDRLRNTNPRQCTEYEQWVKARDIATQCRHKCQQDCRHTEYKFDYKETDYPNSHKTPLDRSPKSMGLVTLNYKKESETEYKERPVQSMCATIQMMFISLLIWFGISIFSFSSVFESAVNKAKPHMYYIHSFDDKVSPSVVSVHPPNNLGTAMGWSALSPQTVQREQPMIKPKFTPTKIGSNVKLEHYNDFISKVIDGCPTAHTVELPQKSAQY